MKKLVVFLFAIGMLAIPLSSFAADFSAGFATTTDQSLPTLINSSDNVGIRNTLSQDKNTMNIMVLNGGTTNAYYKDFNVSEGKTLNFDFAQGNSTLINRVSTVGGESKIYGNMTNTGAGASTSQVILLNPNGFIFGETARVNLNKFTAGTMEGTYDFTNKKINLLDDSAKNKIVIDDQRKGYVFTKTAAGNDPLLAVTGDGNIEIKTGAQIVAHDIALLSNKDVNAGNATIKTGQINVRDDGYQLGSKWVSDIKETFQADNNGSVNIITKGANDAAKSTITLNNTKITAGSINVDNQSTNKSSVVSISNNSNLTAKTGDINITSAATNTGSTKNINIQKSTLNSQNGNLTVNATNGKTYVYNNTKINGKTGVTIAGANSATVNNNKLIQSTNGAVDIHSTNGAVTANNNTKISANGDLKIYGISTTVNNNTNIASTAGDINVYATNGALLADGNYISSVGANKHVKFYINRPGQTVNREATVTVTNNKFGKYDAEDPNNNVQLQGDVIVTADQGGNVTVSNNTINTSKNVNLYAYENDNADVTNNTFYADKVQVRVTNGNATIQNNHGQVNQLNAWASNNGKAKGNVTIDGNDLDVNGTMSATTQNGNAIIQNNTGSVKNVQAKAVNDSNTANGFATIQNNTFSGNVNTIKAVTNNGTAKIHKNKATVNSVLAKATNAGDATVTSNTFSGNVDTIKAVTNNGTAKIQKNKATVNSVLAQATNAGDATVTSNTFSGGTDVTATVVDGTATIKSNTVKDRAANKKAGIEAKPATYTVNVGEKGGYNVDQKLTNGHNLKINQYGQSPTELTGAKDNTTQAKYGKDKKSEK